METGLFEEKVFDSYLKQMKVAFPDVPDVKIESFIRREVKLQDFTLRFDDDVKPVTRNALEMMDFLESEKPIISGYGTLYYRHNNRSSLLAKLFENLLSERDVAKGHMFEHINDEDKSMYNVFNLMQKTYKLLANSGYGATVEANSIFYNKFFGASVTASGVVLITTALVTFENFMSGNIIFYKLQDLLEYVSNIKGEIYSNIDIVSDATKEDTVSWLLSKFKKPSEQIKETIVTIVNTLNQHDLNKVYYKNNLYAFLDNSISEVSTQFESLIGEVFLNPNKPPEALKDKLSSTWNYLQEWVYYNYMSFHRYQRSEHEKRQTVVIVDTDSNFRVPRCA